MEALEKRMSFSIKRVVQNIHIAVSGRAELVASRTNPLTRLLPARLRQDEASLSSGVIAAHHASITWYLSRRLTEASQTQKELQEERIKRQLERTRSLGSGAAQEVLNMQARPLKRTSSRSSSLSSTTLGPGGWLESTIGAAIGITSQHEPHRGSPAITPDSRMVSDDEDDEIELSASQIMQFEAENANILKNMQDTLESVHQAEARLMDISALQMELVTRLTHQTELTDQLYEDALTATITVEKGNEQLKEAKRRAKDSRLFILVFLFGASFSLLFLHYY
jgi:syntaxin 18